MPSDLQVLENTIQQAAELAREALLKGTLALDRIERHERECSRRWGLVLKLLFLTLAQLGALLIFLIGDKLNWIH